MGGRRRRRAFPLPPGWNAKFELSVRRLRTPSGIFAFGAQTIDSGLSLHMLKAGLNYRLGTAPESFKLPDGIDADRWSFHGQSTFLQQYAFPFRRPIGPKQPHSERGTRDF